MSRLLKSPWFISLAGCLLYLATTAALLRPEQFASARPPQPESNSPDDDPSWRFRNPEFEQWVEEIKREKEALAARDQQLHQLQSQLDAQRTEILMVTQTIHELQMDFDRNVVRLKEQELENLKRQTKVINGMSPEGAAAMLREMSDEEGVKILFLLKPDAASLILDTMSKLGKSEAKRAGLLGERLREVLPTGATNPRSPTPK